MHGRQRHGGAPWHPDYVHETLAIPRAKNKLPYETKSSFDTVTLINDAITKSVKLPAIVGENGNLIMMVDFGYEIGFDASRRRRTSVVSVVCDPTGEIITVFPGRPSDNNINPRVIV
jgi:hypothetical protein